jgi:hypothetical protein
MRSLASLRSLHQVQAALAAARCRACDKRLVPVNLAIVGPNRVEPTPADGWCVCAGMAVTDGDTEATP